MERCPSCGGVLGRDCFNPIECAEITASIYEFSISQPLVEVLIEARKTIEWLNNNAVIPKELTETGANMINNTLNLINNIVPNREVIDKIDYDDLPF